MKKQSSSLLAGFVATVMGITTSQVATMAAGKIAVQDPANVVGAGASAWSYLILEGEDYVSETNDAEGVGFTRADNSGSMTNALGNPILGKNTTASKKGALYTQAAAKHGDKVTYQVQFAKPGTYYLYMRFSMFESGVGPASYLNEDSFFVPPDFDKDPQTDWPLSDAGGQNGGYTEGCCDGAGFLFIPEKGGGGVRVSHTAGVVDAAGDPSGIDYWEGKFHWNDLLSSQFLNVDTQGEPKVRRKYEVTAAHVGKTLTWTISNREPGLTVDLFLFSTHPDLMDAYSQDELDALLLAPAKVAVQDPAHEIGTGANAWSYLIVEGEDYDSEANDADGVGFTHVDNNGSITNALGNPILGKNTTASKKGALYVQAAAKHGDKVTYNVKFAKPGTYYLYMRFSMFESGVGPASYLNEDSFFVPPDFNKDPQTDWPLSDAGGQNGGYTEGCCDGAGFLFIPEKGGGGVRISHTAGVVDAAGDPSGIDYWEGKFHWNDLLSSQFLNVDTQGEPKVRRKYEVTAAQVGKTLTWTISNREPGLAVDLFLFSTHPDLMNTYSQEELDELLLPPVKVAVQDPANMVGTGANAWSYLVVEGENYASELNDADGVGFTHVDNSGAMTNALGNSILGKNTTASMRGALYVQAAAKHGDKVTYNVKFAKAGTYYLYMRFSMFESGVGPASYLNEDSFFVPPDFGKDPQTDWPLSDAGGQNGGYTEGCCDGAGFLFIPEKGGGGVRISHTAGVVDAAGDPSGIDYWEGKFHWNDLLSSQFLNATTQGEPKVRRKYEVTAAQVGKTLTWTISNREPGLAVDLFLFSTHPDLMNEYSQDELDQLLVKPSGKVTVQDPANVVGTGATAWSYLFMEGEDYDSEVNDAAGVGFTHADDSGSITNALGNPILGKNTTASKKGALYVQAAAKHGDKVTYQLQFTKAGTYYLYMRFSMFESGVGPASYLNEDSFFVPPDFGKDPQTDWPLSDAGGQNGGYTEGCCDGAGFLFIPEKGGGGVRISHTAGIVDAAGDPSGIDYWEGKFHWNDLLSSQFLNATTQGEPKVRRKYEVTAAQVGKTLTWTISNREPGLAVDAWLFSTHPDLMENYTQDELDQILLAAAPRPKLAVSVSGKNATLSWPASSTGFVLESASTLTSPTWTAVTGAPVVAGGQNSVTVDVSTGAKFYRLKKP